MSWRIRRGAVAVGMFSILCCGCSTQLRAPTFDPMQPDQNQLTAVLGPTTGSGSRTLTVTASRSMSLTMGCIGKGMLTVSGLLSGALYCPNGGSGVFGGYYWAHIQVRVGQRIELRIVAEPKTIWDIRVDGLPRHCDDGVCTVCSQYVGECASLP